MSLLLIVLLVNVSLADRFYHRTDKEVTDIVNEMTRPNNKIHLKYIKQNTKCTHKIGFGDMLKVHYNGTLEDGTMFDTTSIKGEPFQFQLGGRQVIPGWEQGLLNKCEGDRIVLTIPPHLGYGDRTVGMIPANSVLNFEIEIVSATPYQQMQQNQYTQ